MVSGFSPVDRRPIEPVIRANQTWSPCRWVMSICPSCFQRILWLKSLTCVVSPQSIRNNSSCMLSKCALGVWFLRVWLRRCPISATKAVAVILPSSSSRPCPPCRRSRRTLPWWGSGSVCRRFRDLDQFLNARCGYWWVQTSHNSSIIGWQSECCSTWTVDIVYLAQIKIRLRDTFIA